MPFNWQSGLAFAGSARQLAVTLTTSESLGAEEVIDYSTDRFEDFVSGVDAVIDTVGGEIRERSFGVLKRAGSLSRSFLPNLKTQ
jgi:NADPH:quinone reductase-like Zn-dependent oxidoreductase